MATWTWRRRNLFPTRQLVPAKNTFPEESTLRVTDADDPEGRDNRRPGRLALLASTSSSGLVGGLVPSGMRGDEHTAVVEVHEPVLADHLDGLAGQPHPGQVAGRRETRRHPPVENPD